MATQVYGHSDDLIEFEGDLRGEVGCYGTDDDDDLGVLVAFSDGTVLAIRYGKNNQAVWGITALRKGALFDRVDVCGDDDRSVEIQGGRYSDTAWFKDGKLKAWSGKHCEAVR